MNLTFKSRIAFFNTLAAAASVGLALAAIYGVVRLTAYRHLDDDIRREKLAVLELIRTGSDGLELRDDPEWYEREHNRVEVNPTFVQISGLDGRLIHQSENLKGQLLAVDYSRQDDFFSDGQLLQEPVRTGQFPVKNSAGDPVGHLSIGISRAESSLVLDNLFLIMALAYPLLVLIIFLVSYLAASRSIQPVNRLIQAAKTFDEQSLATRLPVPERRDEIRELADTINELLARIERSFIREKQVTADISHEIRTPLAGIRGNLELLLRRRRRPEDYEQKIGLALAETDRLNRLLEQMLLLSRVEAGAVSCRMEMVDLKSWFNLFIERWQPEMQIKRVTVDLHIPETTRVKADPALLEVIVGNIWSNTLKYGNEGGSMRVFWRKNDRSLCLGDDGPGIPAEQLPHIFDRFYRGDPSRNNRIPGAGLGLSIAKKLAELQGIQLAVESMPGSGAHFKLQFPDD